MESKVFGLGTVRRLHCKTAIMSLFSVALIYSTIPFPVMTKESDILSAHQDRVATARKSVSVVKNKLSRAKFTKLKAASTVKYAKQMFKNAHEQLADAIEDEMNSNKEYSDMLMEFAEAEKCQKEAAKQYEVVDLTTDE